MIKVNKSPLDANDLKRVYNSEFIYKTDNATNTTMRIPTKELRTVKCIII